MTGPGSMDDLVAVARIARPRGTKGEVIADVLTDFPGRFEGLKRVTALMPDADRRQLTIENYWFQSHRIVLKFAGIDSIEAAEKLRDSEICIPEKDAVELGRDEYFDWQLIGCRVELISGDKIGTVSEIMRTGGTEILVVAGSKEFLVPFAESICVEVDIDDKVIKVDPPEGLLEF